jgi:ElaB/YqjD/DUF883 family membrane-anchored ribosome-binding protein
MTPEHMRQRLKQPHPRAAKNHSKKEKRRIPADAIPLSRTTGRKKDMKPAKKTRSNAEELAEDLRSRVEGAGKSVRARGDKAVKDSRKNVQEHPLTAVAAGIAAGAVAGVVATAVLTRKKNATSTKRKTKK